MGEVQEETENKKEMEQMVRQETIFMLWGYTEADKSLLQHYINSATPFHSPRLSWQLLTEQNLEAIKMNKKKSTNYTLYTLTNPKILCTDTVQWWWSMTSTWTTSTVGSSKAQRAVVSR